MTQNPARGCRTDRFAKGNRLTSVHLLVVLVLLLLSTPWIQELRHGPLIESGLMTVVYVAAMFAIGVSPSTLRTAGLLMSLAVGARWMEHAFGPAFPRWGFPPFAIIFLGFVIVQLVRSTLEAFHVDLHVLSSAITAYLLLGMLFSLFYLLVDRTVPHSFQFASSADAAVGLDRFNALYFSFVTLSTVGYGDISPASRVARMLATAEATVGMLYVAVLIARLVSLYSSPRTANGSGGTPSNASTEETVQFRN